MLGSSITASNAQKDHHVRSTVDTLNQCANFGNVEGFERVFAAEIGSSRDHVPGRHWPEGLDRRSGKNTLTAINQELIMSVLRTIFSRDAERVPEAESHLFSQVAHLTGLSIKFYPPNAFRWLCQFGHLTIRNIEAALRDAESHHAPHPPLTPECLIGAFLAYDPELALLLSVLQAPVLVGAEEVGRAAKPLIHALTSTHAQPGTLSLREQGGGVENDASTIGNGDGKDANRHGDLVRHAAGSVASLEAALAMLLMTLQSFPKLHVICVLRAFFTTDELSFIIFFLRRELAAKGWTSGHLGDADTMHMEQRRDSGSIRSISNLLDCVMDSIGAAGWIYNSSDSLSTTDSKHVIKDLKAEISSALEVIEEAAYLSGLVGEMLLHKQPDTLPVVSKRNTNAVIVIPPEPTGPKILPLGSRADADILLRKTAMGGHVVQRTSRNIGWLKSRKVGKYTLEKINV